MVLIQKQLGFELSLILPDLRRSVAPHSWGKTNMIMSEHVLRRLAQDFNVTTNRLRIIFDDEGIDRADMVAF